MESPHCAQSPINVVPSVVSKKALDLYLHWLPENGVPTWTPHGLEVRFEPNPENFVRFGTVDFLLDSFHFHHPSEHQKNGKKFASELHIVHKATVAGKERIVVFGIFLTMQPKVDRHVDRPFFEALGKLDRKQQSEVAVPLNPIAWLPPRTANALRYEGSLTTAPYSENVSWVILGERLITQEQYDIIFRGTSAHARVLQSLNRRFVIQYPWDPNGTPPPERKAPKPKE
jgi:carbonic anhydrase